MIVKLDTLDSPSRPGNVPEDGEIRWTLMLPLSNGDELHLTIGKESHDALISILNEESIDDTIDEVIQNGASADGN